MEIDSKHKATRHYHKMNTLLFITDYVMTSSMVNAMMTTKNMSSYNNYLMMASNMVNNTVYMAQEYRIPFTYMVNSFMENVTTILTRMERANETWILLYPITLFLIAFSLQYFNNRRQVFVEVPENVLEDAMITQKRYRYEEDERKKFGEHQMLRRSMRPRVFYMLA